MNASLHPYALDELTTRFRCGVDAGIPEYLSRILVITHPLDLGPNSLAPYMLIIWDGDGWIDSAGPFSPFRGAPHNHRGTYDQIDMSARYVAYHCLYRNNGKYEVGLELWMISIHGRPECRVQMQTASNQEYRMITLSLS